MMIALDGYCTELASVLARGSFFVRKKPQMTSFAFRSELVFPTVFSGSYCSPPGHVLPPPLTLTELSHLPLRTLNQKGTEA